METDTPFILKIQPTIAWQVMCSQDTVLLLCNVPINSPTHTNTDARFLEYRNFEDWFYEYATEMS